MNCSVSPPSWDSAPSPDRFYLISPFVWRHWRVWSVKPNVRHGWVKTSLEQAFDLTRFRLAPESSPAGPRPGLPLSSLVPQKTSLVSDLFLLSFPFLFLFLFSYLCSLNSPTHSIPLFSLHFSFLLHTLSSPPVFSICFLSCSFFPTFFPRAVTAFSYNEKWHIVKVLYFPTSSHTHSELGAKCSWCAASWTSCSATKLAPSHACTPGMHSHSMGFLSAISYVAGLLFLSGTGPSNYKSNYLEKLSLKTRGSRSIYFNTPSFWRKWQKLYYVLMYTYIKMYMPSSYI